MAITITVTHKLNTEKEANFISFYWGKAENQAGSFYYWGSWGILVELRSQTPKQCLREICLHSSLTRKQDQTKDRSETKDSQYTSTKINIAFADFQLVFQDKRKVLGLAKKPNLNQREQLWNRAKLSSSVGLKDHGSFWRNFNSSFGP